MKQKLLTILFLMLLAATLAGPVAAGAGNPKQARCYIPLMFESGDRSKPEGLGD